jgi:hypothetical protein
MKIYAMVQALDSLRHHTLMMGTEMVPETSIIFKQTTWLIAREDFFNLSRRDSFRSCNTDLVRDVDVTA